jgi:hypothetical protein
LAAPIQGQTPVEGADGSGQRYHAIRAVPAMTMSGSTHDISGFALEPTRALAPSRMLQGIQTLDRDAAANPPPSTPPQH